MSKPNASSEAVCDAGLSYGRPSSLLSNEQILVAAERILRRRAMRKGKIWSVAESRDFLRLKLSTQLNEVFAVIWLDSRYRVLLYEEIFLGSIDGASVYPREVVRRALTCNAAAAILVHNHPSGCAEPSQADRQITARLQQALRFIDVRVLNHIVVGDDLYVSFAERGLL